MSVFEFQNFGTSLTFLEYFERDKYQKLRLVKKVFIAAIPKKDLKKIARMDLCSDY